MVELVGREGPHAAALGQSAPLERNDEVHHRARRHGVVEAAVEDALVLRESQRHDAHVENAGARVRPGKRVFQHGAVVLVGHEHDLGVELDARFQQPLQHVDAVLRVLADHASAHLRIRHVQRQAQRRYALLDDAPFVFGLQVGERDEGAREKAQAKIVVA